MAATVARLQAVLSADSRDFDRTMDRSEGRFKSVGKAAMVGAGVVAAAGAYGFKKFAEEAVEAQKVTAQTEAVLKSTGGVANVTAGQVDRLSEALMMKSGVDDEAIASGQNMLLTFTNIRNEVGAGNDVFNQATKATLDLSVAMGKDMQSSAILVGKALNDPIKGMSALSKAGIQFTAEQKESIKAMVESGNAMDAQKMILKELETQFGGSAEAAGKTFGGQVDIAKNTLMNMGGEIVAGVLPSLARFATIIATEVMPRVQEFVAALADRLRPAIATVVDWVRTNWPTIKTVIVAVFDAVERAWNSVLKPVIRAVMDIFGDLRADADQQWGGVRGAAEKVMMWYRENLEPTIRSVVNNIKKFWTDHENDIRTVFELIKRTIGTTLNVIKDVIEGVLALIRGDWQRAWDELKSVVGRVLRGIVDVIKTLGPILADAALELGKAILNGIKDGITSLGSSLKDSLIGTVQGAFDGVKGFFGISSPSKKAADELGKPITEGVAKGILDAKVKALEAAEDVARGILDKAKRTISSGIGSLNSFIQRAFSARQGSDLTPAEKALAEMEKEELAEQRKKMVADLESLRALYGPRAEMDEEGHLFVNPGTAEEQAKILEAERALQKFDLEQKAKAEREALDNRHWLEREAFQKRLKNLQDYLESGRASAEKARRLILDLLDDFNIEIGDIGELLGKSFADGLRAAIPEVVQASKDLTEAFQKAEAAGKAKTKAERDAAAAKAKASRSSGGGGGATGGTGDVNLLGARPELGPFARAAAAFGLSVSSGLRPGAVTRHGTPSDHAVGKAIDVAGSSSGMAGFFRTLVGNSGVKQAFYDPLGSIFGGALSSYREGGHSDHVHVATYDRGGYLKPGWNLAYNGLGKPEPVGFGGVQVNVYGDVSGDEIIEKVRTALIRMTQRNGSTGIA